MVAHKNPDVKGRWHAMWNWVDRHPRYWWFWTIMLLLNTILNILDVAGFGSH